MFPLEFPLNILRRRSRKGDIVLDPFCGRGTTNFAARLVGLSSLGVDSSPVAAAISASKLVTATSDEILAEARRILTYQEPPQQLPAGEFWEWAYHPTVLDALCRFRSAFMEDCSTASRTALRGIILGALHGPKQKTFQSYFSNQCPRTYAPKPGYAVSFWRERGLAPQPVDFLGVIQRRAKRYYSALPDAIGNARLADSRFPNALLPEVKEARFNWVITSPPYYGMRTYIPDQWLRSWFLGGPDTVDYNIRHQVAHSSPEDFADDLRKVWRNAASVCSDEAKMVIRFGGITDRQTNAIELIKNSIIDSSWRITTLRQAGSATEGRRQADTFLRIKTKPIVEYDVWAERYFGVTARQRFLGG